MPDSKPFPGPGPCHCMKLRRASRAVTRFYDEALAQVGITVTQYSLLRKLEREGPLSMGELVRAARLERTTLVRNLRPLEEKGLVKSLPGLRGRGKLVGIAPAGSAALKEAEPAWEVAQKRIEALVEPGERETLGQVLDRLDRFFGRDCG